MAALSLKSKFQQQPKDPNQIDAFATKVTIHAYRADGALSSILKTPMVKHFDQNNRSTFSQPHVVSYPSSGLPWTLSADRGISKNGNDWIKLISHVHIFQRIPKSYDQNLQPTDIYTNTLIIENKKNLAHTDDPVEIKRPDSNTHSIGMQANLKTGDIYFLHHVRGVYDPNQS